MRRYLIGEQYLMKNKLYSVFSMTGVPFFICKNSANTPDLQNFGLKKFSGEIRIIFLNMKEFLSAPFPSFFHSPVSRMVVIAVLPIFPGSL